MGDRLERMSNAAKHRKKAAEFEQLKQIDRAIASYVKAIEESEASGEDVDVAVKARFRVGVGAPKGAQA